AGFSVAGGSVDEDRVLRNDGRAELVEHAVGDDQVGEGLAEGAAVDVNFGGLHFGRGVIFLERDGAGTGVLGDLETFAGEGFAGLGQGEIVVVAGHAFDFDQL